MKYSPFEIMDRILELIDYRGDRKKFIVSFLNLIYERSYMELLKDLDQAEMGLLKERLDNSSGNEDIAETLKQYIEPGRLESTIKVVTAQLYQNYLETIIPTLDRKNRDNLLEYLKIIS